MGQEGMYRRGLTGLQLFVDFIRKYLNIKAMVYDSKRVPLLPNK
jgi:hypothetical protein